MMHIKYILFLTAIIVSLNVMSQNKDSLHPFLDDYNVFEVDGKVHINITIGSGNFCDGIKVLRSKDDLNFILVGNVLGFCGSLSTPVRYDFMDESPILNAESYYKVELGNSGFSQTVPIFVVDTKAYGFQVRPNPAIEQAIIYFENPINEEYELIIYSLSGHRMFSQKSSTNEFHIDTFQLNNGLYSFSIGKLGDTNKVFSKISVQH